MAIYEGDKLIKKKQSGGILAIRILMIVFAIIVSAMLINLSAEREGAYLQLAGSSILSIFLVAAAWYAGKVMHVEYKYYMEDGILHIERSFMYFTTKEVFKLSYKDMTFVCLEKSSLDREHARVKTFDFSSRSKTFKTVVFFDGKECGKGRLLFEPNDELKRSLELFLRDKVQL